MSKIHKKTGLVCMICDEPNINNNVIFHKTRRQTHSLCMECFINYIKPILKISSNNIRKNIKKNSDIIKCPGAFHSEHRNLCKYKIKLSNLIVPECEVSLDIFRITYAMSKDNMYICPEEKCGQVIEIDSQYPGSQLICHECQTSWCRHCLTLPFHTGKSCIELEAENKNTENGKFIWEMTQLGKIKFCPQCHTVCLKENGCNKMICSQCSMKWCWLCLGINIDYDHYNSGKIGVCVGKLWLGVDENGNAV